MTLWWIKAWIWNRALRERVSEIFTHSVRKCVPYASSPELFVCLAAESQHNLQKVWSALKLKELPAFVHVAGLKVINLTTGIGTHDSGVVLQPLEEFYATCFPCLRLGQCSIPKWDLCYVLLKFISSKVLGFLSLVLVFCEITTVH